MMRFAVSTIGAIGLALFLAGCGQQPVTEQPSGQTNQPSSTGGTQAVESAQPPAPATNEQRAPAQEVSTNRQQAELSEPRPFPLAEGTVQSVDLEKGVIVVGYKTTDPKQVIVTSETKITKGGKPATLKDAQVGEPISGRVIKRADGSLEAVSIRLGPKVEPSGGDRPQQGS